MIVRAATTPVRHGRHKHSHSPGQKTRRDVRDQTAAGSQQGILILGLYTTAGNLLKQLLWSNVIAQAKCQLSAAG